MGKSLVIVESPAKAKTINKYLGDDFKVLASMGHIRDLPTNKLGVDLEDDFSPNYTIMPSKRKVISELSSEAKKADKVYLAPDPDREGEAICYHLQEAVIPKDKPTYRVMFNEITKSAVQNAVSHPKETDMKRVDAQQARRILDRLVGYLISPVLWKKVKRGISAGRVQSVALRMIAEREYEIINFDKEEYWAFYAQVEGSEKPAFRTRLMRWQGENIRQGNKPAKATIDNEKLAREVETTLKHSTFSVASIKRKARRQNPAAPFTTSKLQQDASRALSFSVKKTMMIAQKLYEGIEIEGEPVGLITYMRTDSTRVSDEAINQVRDYIGQKFDADYLPAEPRRIKQKSGAQDGHEAIRPTNVNYEPDDIAKFLDKDELRLYTLIWRRFVASQMTAKKMDETVLTIEAGPGEFEAKGLVTTFPGFSVVYVEKSSAPKEEEGDKADLPKLDEGETLKVHELEARQNFTKPPARYSEASLVKALEENGIGRPSTYATILSTIQNRDYVEKRDNRFHPSELGMVVTDLLTKSFPDLMDIKYTAKMEDLLDEVEEGGRTWRELLGEFYTGFRTELDEAEDKMPNMKRDGLETDLTCEECGERKLVIKSGKYGQFLSCSGYPDCTGAKKIKDLKLEDTQIPVLRAMIGQEEEPLPAITEPCPECGGELIHKRGRYGDFIACSNYPDCRYIHKETIGVKCPREDCTGEIQQRKSKKGKIFYSCTGYPKCDFISWDKPNGETCPECKAPTLYDKPRKKNPITYCGNKDCDYSRELETEAVATA
ncbi:MAG: type I DNA topoisomerase [Acidobacteriota bacterium]|nr:type I DNA topoisomerase [Acidobacteriota bacterium]